MFGVFLFTTAVNDSIFTPKCQALFPGFSPSHFKKIIEGGVLTSRVNGYIMVKHRFTEKESYAHPCWQLSLSRINKRINFYFTLINEVLMSVDNYVGN